MTRAFCGTGNLRELSVVTAWDAGRDGGTRVSGAVIWECNALLSHSVFPHTGGKQSFTPPHILALVPIVSQYVLVAWQPRCCEGDFIIPVSPSSPWLSAERGKRPSLAPVPSPGGSAMQEPPNQHPSVCTIHAPMFPSSGLSPSSSDSPKSVNSPWPYRAFISSDLEVRIGA